MTELALTHTGRVTPDQIDDLGHMNVRFYGMNAAAATRSFCADLGIGEPRIRTTYTRHHHEQMLGNELAVHTALADGAGGLRLYHELRNRASGELAATFVHDLDHPAVEAPTIDLPAHGQPRSLNLETDGLTSAPAFRDPRLVDRAARKPRRVTAEDTGGEPVVPTWLVNNLVWGGERLDDEVDWIRTLPDGTRYAFVVMESRCWIDPEPVPIGTPIQSFTAVLEIGEKIEREISWSYNTETGRPLVAIESVELCFNMTDRRAMQIPAHSRATSAPWLCPELAPERGVFG